MSRYRCFFCFKTWTRTSSDDGCPACEGPCEVLSGDLSEAVYYSRTYRNFANTDGELTNPMSSPLIQDHSNTSKWLENLGIDQIESSAKPSSRDFEELAYTFQDASLESEYASQSDEVVADAITRRKEAPIPKSIATVAENPAFKLAVHAKKRPDNSQNSYFSTTASQPSQTKGSNWAVIASKRISDPLSTSKGKKDSQTHNNSQASTNSVPGYMPIPPAKRKRKRRHKPRAKAHLDNEKHDTNPTGTSCELPLPDFMLEHQARTNPPTVWNQANGAKWQTAEPRNKKTANNEIGRKKPHQPNAPSYLSTLPGGAFGHNAEEHKQAAHAAVEYGYRDSKRNVKTVVPRC